MLSLFVRPFSLGLIRGISWNDAASALYRVVTENDGPHLATVLHQDLPAIEKSPVSHPPSVYQIEVALKATSLPVQRQ